MIQPDLAFIHTTSSDDADSADGKKQRQTTEESLLQWVSVSSDYLWTEAERPVMDVSTVDVLSYADDDDDGAGQATLTRKTSVWVDYFTAH